MKLPIPWRRRSIARPQQAVEKTPTVKEPPIDITEPRECIHKSFEDHPGSCPRCGGSLQQSRQTYLVVTRRGRKVTDSFIIGSDFGWFCSRCPTVVIDPADVSEMLQHRLSHWDVGSEFAVAGIIDLDAVPEEKSHLPLGDDDNPIPLVEFTNFSRGRSGAQPDRQAGVAGPRQVPGARKKQGKRKKRRR